MRQRTSISLVWIVAAAIAGTGLCCADRKDRSTIRIGHAGSPATASLYALHGFDGIELLRFSSGEDAAYALIAGEIDAALLSPEKAVMLVRSPSAKSIAVAGAWQFPYGVTLAVHHSLDIRLNDLGGKRIAVSSPRSRLLRVFAEELTRYGIDVRQIRFVVLSYQDMLPALTAGKIDGALLKGSSIGPATAQGHTILYQKWDVPAGDDCCPPIVAQLEQVLLVRNDRQSKPDRLTTLLESAEKVSQDSLKRVLTASTLLDSSLVESIPLGTFQRADTTIIRQFAKHGNHGAVVAGIRFDDEFTEDRCTDACHPGCGHHRSKKVKK